MRTNKFRDEASWRAAATAAGAEISRPTREEPGWSDWSFFAKKDGKVIGRFLVSHLPQNSRGTLQCQP